MDTGDTEVENQLRSSLITSTIETTRREWTADITEVRLTGLCDQVKEYRGAWFESEEDDSAVGMLIWDSSRFPASSGKWKTEIKGKALVGNVDWNIINVQIVAEALTIGGICLPRKNGHKRTGC